MAGRLENASVRFSEVLESHLTAIGPRVTAQTASARRKRVEAVIAHTGNLPLIQVSKAKLARWVNEVLLPGPGAVKTKRDKLTDLSAFFGWATDSGNLESNPASGLSRLIVENKRGLETPERRHWKDTELRDLITDIGTLKKNQIEILLPLVKVGMYSGMRLNEICAIQGKDIEDGCFKIREGKNRNSVRCVPVHSALVDLVDGLGKEEYLIPHLTPSGENLRRGHEASKQFGRVKKKLGYGPELTFHCLRNTFINKLEFADIPETTTELIVGHARQGRMSYGRYSKELPMEKLRQAVEKVKYDLG